MLQGKSALSSTSIQGDILAVIGAVGSYMELAGKLPLGGASVVLTVVGAVFSIFGRFKAKDPIKSIF